MGVSKKCRSLFRYSLTIIMKAFLICLGALAFVFVSTFARTCERSKHHGHGRIINLSDSTLYLENIAHVHSMTPVGQQSADCELLKKFSYVRNSPDGFTFTASEDCRGVYKIDSLAAYCAIETLVGTDKGYLSQDLQDPCEDGSIYSMTPVATTGDCGGHNQHRGMGNYYGFANKTIWVDEDCRGTFKVCEIGQRMDMGSMDMS